MKPPVLTVGIKELKNQLSRYIREVVLGNRVLVRDRNKIVAELRPPELDFASDDKVPLRALEEAQKGGLRMPARTKRKGIYKIDIVNLPEGTALKLLSEDRDE